MPSTRGLLSEQDVALTSCSDATVVFTNDPAWQVERFGYDANGNQTVHHRMAATDGSPDRWTNTAYDGNYHLFPVSRSAGVQPGVVLTETASNIVNDQRYYAYGRRLDVGGDISGEKDFTGQRKDATGLVYMNARYYDPTLEQFISPYGVGRSRPSAWPRLTAWRRLLTCSFW